MFLHNCHHVMSFGQEYHKVYVLLSAGRRILILMFLLQRKYIPALAGGRGASSQG